MSTKFYHLNHNYNLADNEINILKFKKVMFLESLNNNNFRSQIITSGNMILKGLEETPYL